MYAPNKLTVRNVNYWMNGPNPRTRREGGWNHRYPWAVMGWVPAGKFYLMDLPTVEEALLWADLATRTLPHTETYTLDDLTTARDAVNALVKTHGGWDEAYRTITGRARTPHPYGWDRDHLAAMQRAILPEAEVTRRILADLGLDPAGAAPTARADHPVGVQDFCDHPKFARRLTCNTPGCPNEVWAKPLTTPKTGTPRGTVEARTAEYATVWAEAIHAAAEQITHAPISCNIIRNTPNPYATGA